MFLVCFERRVDVFLCDSHLICNIYLWHYIFLYTKYIYQSKYWSSCYFLLQISKQAQILLDDFWCLFSNWCFGRIYFELKCWIHCQEFQLIYGTWYIPTPNQTPNINSYKLCLRILKDELKLDVFHSIVIIYNI